MSSNRESGKRKVMMTALQGAIQKVTPSSSRRGSLQRQSNPGSAANSAPTSPVLTQRQDSEAARHDCDSREEPHPGELVDITSSPPAGPVTAPPITYPDDVRIRTAQHHSLDDFTVALASLSRDSQVCVSPQSTIDSSRSNESGRTDDTQSNDQMDILMSRVSEFTPLLSGESWTDGDLRNALLECSVADADEEWRDEKWSKLRSVLDKVAKTTHNPDVASAVHHFQGLMNPSRPILEPGPSVYPGATYYQRPG